MIRECYVAIVIKIAFVEYLPYPRASNTWHNKLIFSMTLWGYSHFIDEEAEAKEGQVTYLPTDTEMLSGTVEFEPRQLGTRVCTK